MRNHRGWGVVAAVAVALPLAAQAAEPAKPAKLPGKESSRGVIVLQPKADAPAVSTTPSATKADPVPTRTEPAPPVAPAPQPVQPQPVQLPPAVQPLPAPIVKSCARPFPNSDLRLGADKGFANALAARLRRGQRVVVDLALPYREGDGPPAALAPWFARVQESGGSVTVKHYCQASRGLGAWLSRMFKRDSNRLYAPAANFNVVQHSDGLDQLVTQVEFVPKSAR